MLAKRHLTPRKASAILALVRHKVAYRSIVHTEHVSLGQISRAVTRAKENPEDPTARRPQSGRPKFLSVRDQRRLVRMAVQDRHISIKELCRVFECSVPTVKSALDKYGYHRRIARRKPFLKAEHKRIRLAFALAHEHWSIEDWSQVLFSDEYNIELGLDSRVIWVWRQPAEEYLAECLTPTFKSSRTSVRVWAYIKGKELGSMVMLDGRMNGEKYIRDVLKAEIQPALRKLTQEGHKYFYMHDGAPCHRSKLVENWLSKNRVPMLKWPACSPDLNPIENLWLQLKRAINKRPEVAKNAADLRRIIQEEWCKLDRSCLKGLVESMPARIQACIKAKGGHTRW